MKKLTVQIANQMHNHRSTNYGQGQVKVFVLHLYLLWHVIWIEVHMQHMQVSTCFFCFFLSVKTSVFLPANGLMRFCRHLNSCFFKTVNYCLQCSKPVYQNYFRLKGQSIIQPSSNHQLFDNNFVRSWLRVASFFFGHFTVHLFVLFLFFSESRETCPVHEKKLQKSRVVSVSVVWRWTTIQTGKHFYQVTDCI